MRFNNPLLMDLFERLHRVPTEVLVKRPGHDVNFIYVLDPQTKHYFRVEWRTGGYKFPMPRFLHKEIWRENADTPEAKDDAPLLLHRPCAS